jgi:hypothetical protein
MLASPPLLAQTIAASRAVLRRQGRAETPGSPKDSILYFKTDREDPAPCGSKCTLGGPPLSAADAALIEPGSARARTTTSTACSGPALRDWAPLQPRVVPLHYCQRRTRSSRLVARGAFAAARQARLARLGVQRSRRPSQRRAAQPDAIAAGSDERGLATPLSASAKLRAPAADAISPALAGSVAALLRDVGVAPPLAPMRTPATIAASSAFASCGFSPGGM